MRVTWISALALSLLFVGASSAAGQSAGDEPKVPSTSVSCLDQALFRGSEQTQSSPALDPAQQFRWASTGEEECPPAGMICVYYAGSCGPCGFNKVRWCDTWRCPNNVYYTCCGECDWEAC
jgi:hypothetical protein